MSNYKAEYNVHLISGICNDANTPIARAKDIEVDRQKTDTTNYTLDEVLTDLQSQIDNAGGGGSSVGKGYYIYGMLPNPASFREWKQNAPDEPIYQPTEDDNSIWNSLCENIENAWAVQGALLLTANKVTTIDYPSEDNSFGVILSELQNTSSSLREQPQWVEDDLLSIVNGVHYDNCAKVAGVVNLGNDRYAVLYKDKTRTFDKTVGATGGPGAGKDVDGRHSFSVRVATKPSVGEVELMQYGTATSQDVIASGENAFATGWNTVAGGAYSTAEGAKTYAAYAAHAEGQSTTAGREQAHAEGLLTKALGVASHAEGSETSATGDFSHAENYFTKSQGKYSHAEGSITTASGTASHAEGDNTNANGNYSHAEGLGTSTALGATAAHAEGQNTRANAPYAHAEGYGAKATASYTHAEGYNSTASGEAAHAEGYSTSATGDYSHAQGNGTVAQGKYSSASGVGTRAIGEASSARGKYATSSADYLEVVGNGVSANQRHNAYSVDYEGNFNISGDVLDENGTPVTGSNIISVQPNNPLMNRTPIVPREVGVMPVRVHKGDMIRDVGTGDTAVVTTLTLNKKLYTGSSLPNVVMSPGDHKSWGQVFTLRAGETVTSLAVKFGAGPSGGTGTLQFYQVSAEDSAVTIDKVLSEGVDVTINLNEMLTVENLEIVNDTAADIRVYWKITLADGCKLAPFGSGSRAGVKCVVDDTVFTEGSGWDGAYSIGATVGIEGATSARGDEVAELHYGDVVTNGSQQRGCAVFGSPYVDVENNTCLSTDLMGEGAPQANDLVILTYGNGNVYRINNIEDGTCQLTLLAYGKDVVDNLIARVDALYNGTAVIEAGPKDE